MLDSHNVTGKFKELLYITFPQNALNKHINIE